MKKTKEPYKCDSCLKDVSQVNFTGFTSMYWFCPECYHKAKERQKQTEKTTQNTVA
jgi:ribosomal protein L37AE/L43A